MLMNRLYQGSLRGTDAGAAVAELERARDELRAFAPDQVVWDIEDLSAGVTRKSRYTACA
jgi:hypothetical protein